MPSKGNITGGGVKTSANSKVGVFIQNVLQLNFKLRRLVNCLNAGSKNASHWRLNVTDMLKAVHALLISFSTTG